MEYKNIKKLKRHFVYTSLILAFEKKYLNLGNLSQI